MGYISKELLMTLDFDDFTPGKIIEQLKFLPIVFDFLKSKELQMGKVRPLVTYMIGVTIWAFREKGEPKRDLPEDFFYTLWERFATQRHRAKLLGGTVQHMEPELWSLFLKTIQGESIRDRNLLAEEIGVGALVFAVVLIGIYIYFQITKG